MADRTPTDVPVAAALHAGLTRILPPTVHCAEVRGPVGRRAVRDDEAHLVGLGVRSLQSVVARDCGRSALADLGFGPVGIPRTPSGMPRWPRGVVGSLTHTDGYVAAAVGLRRHQVSLGIDAEPNEPVGAPILAYTCHGEPEAVAELGRRQPEIAWDRLLFSAKEAAFKAFFAVSGRTVPMTAARATLDQNGTFVVSTEPFYRVAGERWDWTGRWCLSGGFLLTATVVPRRR